MGFLPTLLIPVGLLGDFTPLDNMGFLLFLNLLSWKEKMQQRAILYCSSRKENYIECVVVELELYIISFQELL